MISTIRSVNLATPVQRVKIVSQKARPEDEEPGRKGRPRSAPKEAAGAREPISVVSASAQARSSSAVQAVLIELKR